MIKSLVILIAELNESLKSFLIDFFLKLGMGIGVLIGGLAGNLIYIAIIGFGIWLIYTVVRLIYEGFDKPGETILSKLSKKMDRFENLVTFLLWLLMMIIIVIIAYWLS